MTVDPAVLPGLLLLVAELATLAAVGYVVVRVALRQDDDRAALAQGLVVGPAIWGLIVNFVLYAVPGMAGAAVGWGLTLALGGILIWRAPNPIGPRPRVAAGFAVVVVALLWAGLASRQLLWIPDPQTQLGLAVSLREGAYPPELFWSPGTPSPYHHGVSLLVGLLTPPVGPDPAFVTEIFGAYCWASLILIVTTALLQRASLVSVLVAAPLLLSAGLWTFSNVSAAVFLLPVPAGLPEAGLRASLGDVYWPSVALSANPMPPLTDLLPDIWKPHFPLGYALTFVVLERAARSERAAWPAAITLAGLVGFLSLVSPTLVPVAGVLWAALSGWQVMRARRSGSARNEALRAGTGLALAVALILGGGGAFARVLSGAPSSGFELAPSLHEELWQALGTFAARPGGVGLLGVGPLAVAGVAVVLARRDRLVLALAAGAVVLALAWMVLTYPPAPWDVNRFAGHARNLALAAVLLALTARLHDLRPHRRHIAAALVAILITWPTVVVPARNLGLAIGRGVELANAGWVSEELPDRGETVPRRRFQIPLVSEDLAAYIRDHVALDARVLGAEGRYWNVFFATGRPNNAGFAGLTHLNYLIGAEYLDAVHYLEPAALRALGIEYVHATDAWIAELPTRAQGWLGDPRLFELLASDDRERLYRVRQAFLSLDAPPDPASFEALRQAVPPSATVYLVFPHTRVQMVRVASALSHARLIGQMDPQQLHLVPPARWQVDPLTDETPDLVVLPTNADPWMFESSARTPIWWREGVGVYAPDGAMPRIMDGAPPDGPVPGVSPPVLLEVTEVTVADGRIEFVAAFEERDSQGWTGQDWVVIKGDRSPWAIPTEVFRRGDEPTNAKWFGGLLSPGGATSTHTYRFDVRTAELSVRNDAGAFVPLPTSAADLGPGGYTLALRLRHEYQPNYWRDAAVIPVVRIRVAETGEVSFEVFDDVLRGSPLP